MMAKHQAHIETRKITKEEAQACANEKVQFIGKIQPHGFLLVVDSDSKKIVQYSENVISAINSRQNAALPVDTTILNSSLFTWLNCQETLQIDELLPSNTLSLPFKAGGYISPNNWECLISCSENYIILDCFPISKQQSTFNLLTNLDRMVARIRAHDTLEGLYKAITEEFQKHTQYDRVMLYHFLPDWSGEVIAESVSQNQDIRFLGMRFPAEDIPKGARDLYLKSTLRVMADVDATPVAIVPNLLPSGKPLDQSNSVLRAMSAMHVKYLKNMGVKASLSIGLIANKKLWGLMAFHHYEAKIPPQSFNFRNEGIL
jgi:light-regulated signal transduction histidine kinase (bacteriophytochrome)